MSKYYINLKGGILMKKIGYNFTEDVEVRAVIDGELVVIGISTPK